MVARTKQHVLRLLKWSEKYTRTDMTYLAKGGFWVSFGYCIQIAAGLITMIALANLLPRESLGTYQYILAGSGLLSALTLSGMGVALTRAVAKGSHSVLLTGFRTKLLWSIIVVILAGILASYYYINENNELALGFLIIGAFVPFLESFNLYESFLTGKEHFKQSVLLGAWRKPIPIISIIVTAYFSSNPVLLVFAYFFSHTITAGTIFLLVIQKYETSPSNEEDRDSIIYGKHLSLMRFLPLTATHADKLLLFHFLGPVEVAIFSIAQLPVKYTENALAAIRSLLLPKLSKRDFLTLQETLPRKVFFFFLLALGATLLYILLSPFIFLSIFPDYSESILITQALALTILFLPRTIYGHALIAHKKTKRLYVIYFIIPTIKILLLIVLIPLYGIWGAVYAHIISQVIGATINYGLFKRP